MRILLFILFNAILGSVFAIDKTKNKTLVDFVNPNIGTIGHLLVSTASIVQEPHGIVQLGHNVYPEISDRYLSDKISSFSIRALPWYTTQTVPSWIMATTGTLKVTPIVMSSLFDPNIQVVSPYYSRTLLEEYRIIVENSATSHAAIYRFTFPASDSSHILLGNNSKIKVVNQHCIEAEEIMPRPRGQKAYYYIQFSKNIQSIGTWKGRKTSLQIEQEGDSIGAYATFATKEGEKVEVRIGVSLIDVLQAKENLNSEIPNFEFEKTKNKAKDKWNKVLGKITIEGASDNERVIFYTSLYRVLLGSQTVNLTEYGRYVYDGKIFPSLVHNFYRVSTNWGSHHSLFPLQLLLEPDRINDMIISYLRMEETNGYLSNGGGRRGMIARHEVASITDAYIKGFRNYDIKKVYEALRKSSLETTMIAKHQGPSDRMTELDSIYLQKGFFPSIPPTTAEWVSQIHPDMRRQSVSITLENCYDDWCMGVLAAALDKPDDYSYFMNRANNYKNVFDSATGFMRPKMANGKWIEPFDPVWSGGEGGRDYYTENNGWNYTFYVPHDIFGLALLMGGRSKLKAKLDELFTTSVSLYQKHKFLGQFPDMTGLIGMYSHGNQPTLHIPYIYNYIGEPWMTQRRVRQIMDIWYFNSPLGICGDEDYGELSSWYVFSALGFYPVSPGSPTYNIGSPLFRKATINIGNKKTFTVEAINVSHKNKYIQSASLNGNTIDRPWFTHDELMSGGALVLHMGPVPNKLWGQSPEAAPPSMSPKN